MNKKGAGESIGRTLGDLLLFAGGNLLFVSTVMHLSAPADAAPNATTALVEMLIGFCGAAPLLLLAGGLGVVGAVDFLARGLLPAARSAAGLFGVALGGALVIGAFTTSGGGALGAALPEWLPGVPGVFLAFLLGLAIASLSSWWAWLPGLEFKTEKLGQTSPIAAVLREDAGDGVSRAEAEALLPARTDLRRVPLKGSGASAPPRASVDIRHHGGIPEGARPLDPVHAGPEPQGAPETAGLEHPDDLAAAGADAAAEHLAAGRSSGPAVHRPDPAEAGSSDRRGAAERPSPAGHDRPIPPGASPLAASPLALGGGVAAPAWESAGERESEQAERLVAVEAARRAAEAEEREAFSGNAGEAPELDDVAGSSPVASWEQAELFDSGARSLSAEIRDSGGEQDLDEQVDWMFVGSSPSDAEELDSDADSDSEVDLEAREDEDAELDADRRAGIGGEGEGPAAAGAERASAGVGEGVEELGDVGEQLSAPTEPEVELVPRAADEERLRRRKLVFAAGCLILEHDRVAVSMLQRRFELDFDRATELLDELQDAGLIGPYLGGTKRDILLTLEDWKAMAPGL